ncbi:hypothetical protein BESB_013270 [Besnoitia besnoiti]|uniref:Uncharacterized protein n=1 Tax=Besnoitia besnoiti TaxID=94643 RepID=A0A2A9M423_BESBE|nr:hypothetical protein BESB_013270 [Besnoitia besnoiti]PFH32715.1 hypothetical protein BESB_013270 [Besnoitia besnoiti]
MPPPKAAGGPPPPTSGPAASSPSSPSSPAGAKPAPPAGKPAPPAGKPAPPAGKPAPPAGKPAPAGAKPAPAGAKPAPPAGKPAPPAGNPALLAGKPAPLPGGKPALSLGAKPTLGAKPAGDKAPPAGGPPKLEKAGPSPFGAKPGLPAGKDPPAPGLPKKHLAAPKGGPPWVNTPPPPGLPAGGPPKGPLSKGPPSLPKAAESSPAAKGPASLAPSPKGVEVKKLAVPGPADGKAKTIGLSVEKAGPTLGGPPKTGGEKSSPALGATPPSLRKTPGAEAGADATKAASNMDEYGAPRGTFGRLTPHSSLARDIADPKLQRIFTASGKFVGRATGPPPPLSAQERSSESADRGRGRLRLQEHRVADPVPRPARSGKAAGSSRRLPSLFSPTPFAGSADGMTGFFVPVPTWPPTQDQAQAAFGCPPFFPLAGFPPCCPPYPYYPASPGDPNAAMGCSPFPPYSYMGGGALPCGPPGALGAQPAAGGDYFPPNGTHGQAALTGERTERRRNRNPRGEEDGAEEGQWGNLEGRGAAGAARRGQAGVADRAPFTEDQRAASKPQDCRGRSQSTREATRRRRATMIQFLEDEGFEPPEDWLRANGEKCARVNDPASAGQRWDEAASIARGPQARAFNKGPEKPIGRTPWGGIEKQLNRIRSRPSTHIFDEEDEDLPRLPSEVRSFDPVAFARRKKEREALGQDPTFGVQEGNEYYQYFDAHYKPDREPWLQEVVPRLNMAFRDAFSASHAPGLCVPRLIFLQVGASNAAPRAYNSVPPGGKFSSKASKGWDRWGFEKGLTVPRKRTYQSLNELATYFSHLESEDQDEVISLLLLCRKLEKQLEEQHVVIDMLEHDLTTANASLKFPPEWRTLEGLDLVSLVPADTAFQPTAAAPLFLKSTVLLPQTTPDVLDLRGAPEASSSPAAGAKSPATEAPAGTAKPAPGATFTVKKKAVGAAKKPVFKTTIKAKS